MRTLLLALYSHDCEACSAMSLDEPLWRALSGATTVYIPRNHQPDWYWKEIWKKRGIGPSSGYEDVWLDRLYGEAQAQILGCWVHGGRYWELTVNITKLFHMTTASSKPRFLRHLSRLSGQEDDLDAESLPDMRLSICAPQECEGDSMPSIFERTYAQKFMGRRASLRIGNSSLSDVLHIEELADWSSLHVDFVVGGVDGCGTSSLHRNLNEHPEIAFSTWAEDFFFTEQLAHRLLPLKSQVDGYNAQLKTIADEQSRRFGIRPRLIGTCNPTIFSYALARRKFASMPNLKMIVILCDPLGRMEKLFMEYHFCGQAGAPKGQCFQSAGALLKERHRKLRRFWRSRAIAEHMPSMMSLFSGRILFVHQEQLRNHAQETYLSLANFLGARYSFPHETMFLRYNSVGGHRTDLCHNQTLVSLLKRELEPEYLMQETLMRAAEEVVPERLRRRLTRCDFAQDATSCPGRTACT